MIIGLTTTTAHAELQKNRYCIRFNATYDDNSNGEDYLKNDGLVAVPGVPYSITRGLDVVATGELDLNGCTDILKLTVDNTYKIHITYQINGADGRTVKFLSQNATSWKYGTVYSYYTTTKIYKIATSDGGPATIYRNMPNTVHGRLLPIARLMLERADILNWPTGVDIYYAIDNPTLCNPIWGHFLSGHSSDNLKKICYSTDTQKTAFAHETGHAIAHMHGGPNRGDYAGDTYLGARCIGNSYCHAPTTHKFFTREWVGAAASEGFAHFIAAATFNWRSTASGVFTYYKNNVYTTDFSGPTPASTPIKVGRYHSFELNGIAYNGNPNTLPTYSNLYCQPPTIFKHLGSEGDWLFFFWGLWTGGGESRFNIAEIKEVWANTPATEKAIDVHCVRRDIPGSEHGWTCFEAPWTYYSPSVEFGWRYDDGQWRLGFTHDEIIPSIKSIRGKGYYALANAALIQLGPEKKSFFEDTARRARVVY